MRKENWTYRKVKEVCDKASSNIVLNKIENNVGDYALYGASGFVKGVDFFHREEPYIGIVKDGSGVGRVDVFPAKSSLVGTMQYILPKKDCLLKYLCYVLQSLKLADFVTGAAIPHIYFRDYGECVIPIPPLATQSRIVSELDLLQSIIDKQKAQVKELDNLAQSIFYDMFGDPVENEKGWEVKKFGELFKLKSGDGLSTKSFVEGNVPVYGGNGISGYHNKSNKHGKYIIIGRVGVYCGNSRYVNDTFWLTDNAFELIFSDKLFDYRWLNTLLNALNLTQYANHAAQPVISNTGLKDIVAITPPLPLQQSFAQKVEAIERQKELINQSIAEVQTLFDSQMDYYFGE